jgi:hypothetical protein
MPADTTRIEKILARISAERAAISRVEVKSGHFQQQLRRASWLLDTAESDLLSPEALTARCGIPRTNTWLTTDEGREWLTSVENLIKSTTELREDIQRAIAEAGPDVRTFYPHELRRSYPHE